MMMWLASAFNYLLKAATIDRRISGGNLEEYLDDADNAKLCEFIWLLGILLLHAMEKMIIMMWKMIISW